MTGETRVLFAGGGSGGHLFPGLAVAEELRRSLSNCRVEFVAADRPADRSIFAARPNERATHLSVESTAGLFRRPWSWLTTNRNAYLACRTKLVEFRPHCVVGLGGFASVPAVLAASRMGLPIVLLEQNVFPGRATVWLSRMANRVCLSYEQTRSALPSSAETIVTGNPVRREFLACADEGGSHPDVLSLVVLGGSLGATALNEAMPMAVARLPEALLRTLHVIHQTGADRVAAVEVAYAKEGIPARVTPFIDNMADRLSQASLVVSRAGGTTLAELACLGVPSLLVPYPQAAQNHQWHNTRPFVAANAARLVPQKNDRQAFSSDLQATLAELLSDRRLRSEMRNAMQGLARPSAAEEVGRVIRSLVLDESAPAKAQPETPRRVHSAEEHSPSHFEYDSDGSPRVSRSQNTH